MNTAGIVPRSYALIFLCSICTQTVSAAVDEDQVYRDLLGKEQQIHVDPLASYQELQLLEADIADYSPRTRSVFYLRKAQAENFLYLFDEFAESIAFGATIDDAQVPQEIRTWYELYRCLVLQRDNKYQAASDCYQDVILRARRTRDARALVFALQELAYTESLNESFAQALDYLQEAHFHASRSKQKFLVGIVEETSGAVYGYLDDYENSIAHYQNALEIYQELGFRTYMAEAHYGLASTYRYWGKLDLALSHYKTFTDIFDNDENTHHRFLALYGLAMTYAAQGDCPRSLAAIEKTRGFSGLNDYRAELHKKQALCLAERGALAEARLALENARDLLDGIPELKGTTWQLELLQVEASILAAEHKHDQAYTLMQQFHEAYLKQYQAQASGRLSSLRTNMEGQRKDLEIEQLRQARLVDAIELEKQQRSNEIQKYITVIWIIIACTFVFFIFNQWRYTRKLMKLSFRDPLTKLYNRRYIFDLLNKLIAKAEIGKMHLTLILMDIDDFKHINDSHGHPLGDRVLCEMAQVCLDELRHNDSIGRIGGEEFLVILPREGEAQTLQIAERIRRAVEKAQVLSDKGNKIGFTVSIGIARLDADCMHANLLFKRADQALYQAKQQGKNRIVEYREDPEIDKLL